ncbi:MAG: V-type ATPase 116kDa subunit family protein, partial [Oscillospiraceae bacterium]
IAKIDQLESAYKQLSHIKNLPISLDEILSCKYLKMHFGKLPHDSFMKLPYFDDKTFVFHELSREGMYHWGVYITTLDDETEVDDIFDSLYFEKIDIPNFVHGVPENAEDEILQQIEIQKQQLSDTNKEIEKTVKEYKEDFINLYIRFKFLKQAFLLRKYVSAAKNKFVITGFIPDTDNEKFTKIFEHISNINISISPAKSEDEIIVPTKLKNGWFSKPFEMFVDMYGLPCYEDFDPTKLFAITYTILFGIMFGDLGQGLAFAIIGYILTKKTGSQIGGIITRVGFSSAFFGFWYGSVFGDEYLLDPIFINVFGMKGKPIHVMEPATTSTLLIAAIALGVVLIVISILVNIFVGFKRKDFERAIFSNNGIAGAVFYIYILCAVALKFTTEINILNPVCIILFIAIPLVVIFLKHPLGMVVRGEKVHFEGGIGGFITEGIFELFEVCLSFVTNTMSFLRVGGFILSHAGMMLVVMTLSEMMSGAGSIIVSILGNLFVMGLEGFIVGIQALRLEFYEMFSRYYGGDGIPFTPIAIKEENSVLVND